MAEIKRGVTTLVGVGGDIDGEEFAIIGPRQSLADIARWIAKNPVDAQEMIRLLREQLELPQDMRDQTALEMIRDYQTALEEIAAPAIVPLHRKPRKMYRRWRKMAVGRIDIARKALGVKT